jgi:predicted glycosyltransferase involved in capsule biosynthesis
MQKKSPLFEKRISVPLEWLELLKNFTSNTHVKIKNYILYQKRSRGKKWNVCARNSEMKQILKNIYKTDLQIIPKPI